MAQANKKVANSLIAVGAAAVMAVYAAGYSKTQSAADRFDAQSAGRRPAPPNATPGAPPAPAADTAAPIPDAPPLPALAQPPKVASISNPAPAPSSSPVTAPPVPAPAAVAPVNAIPSVPAVAAPAPAPVVIASALPPAATVAVAPPAAPATAPTPAPAAAPAKWKDGTYTGWGSCRHGDIQSQVVIEGGRIKSATIAQCLTRYDCNVIGRLPPEVAQRQSAEVDYVSGATQSADAFYYSVMDALSKAK